MPVCKNCGAHVSERFKRVFGDETGEIYACINCAANTGIGEATRNRGDRNE